MSTDYALSRPLAARLLGGLLVVLGVVVVLVTILGGLAGAPGWVTGGTVLAAGAVVLAAVVVLWRPITVVRLTETGYRVRWVRGVGTAQARWTDVEDAVATTVAGDRCVVIRLRDGRTTTIPVRLLAGSAETFADDVRRHLDTGHGYRRLR